MSVAAGQSNAISLKAEAWRRYLAELAKEAREKSTFTNFRIASLWASTFAYVEWLATFERYETRPDATEMALILRKYWGWDEDIGKLFVYCGRNPIAHVGQANPFHTYHTYNGLPTIVSFNVKDWSDEV